MRFAMTTRLNTENLLVELRGLYGNNVTTADLRAYCAMNTKTVVVNGI
jgi:hypothetical protein